MMVVAAAAVAALVGCGASSVTGQPAAGGQYTVKFEVTVDPAAGATAVRAVPSSKTVGITDLHGTDPVTGTMTCNLKDQKWNAEGTEVEATFSIRQDVLVGGAKASLSNLKVDNVWPTDPPRVSEFWQRNGAAITELKPEPLANGATSNDFSYRWSATPINPGGAVPLVFVLYVSFDAEA